MIKGDKRIAIIVPVYNTVNYIEECFDSLKEQTYKNFTAIVIDDGSTDGSSDIVDRYASVDARFFVVHKKNGGVSSARNHALDIIERDGFFDYVAFVDSDDKLSCNFLHDFVLNINRYDLDYAVCGVSIFSKSRVRESDNLINSIEILDQEEIANQYFGLGIWNEKCPEATRFLSNKIFSASAIKGFRFNEKLMSGEDMDYFIRVSFKLKSGVYFSNRNYLYRLRRSSLSHSKANPINNTYYFEKLFNKANANMELREGLERALLDSWWSAVRYAFENNEIDCRRECNDIYCRLVKRRFSFVLEKKYLRRFKLYRLGGFFLKIYFFVRKSTKKSNDTDFFS